MPRPILSAFFGKLVFGCATNGTDPIFRQLFEWRVWLHTVFWITCCRIIYIAAYETFPLVQFVHHFFWQNLINVVYLRYVIKPIIVPLRQI